MNELDLMLRGVLEQAGYRTWLVSVAKHPTLCFEDDSVMGFATVFEDAASLVTHWKETELQFLQHFRDSITRAGDKAWNIYSVFVTSRTADAKEMRALRQIDEDLERTRKITASGITYREGLIAALLPLLPLQYQPALETEDVAERLRRRLLAIAPEAADVVLDDSVSPRDVARRLEDAQ